MMRRISLKDLLESFNKNQGDSIKCSALYFYLNDNGICKIEKGTYKDSLIEDVYKVLDENGNFKIVNSSQNLTFNDDTAVFFYDENSNIVYILKHNIKENGYSKTMILYAVLKINK